jgi:hypothetical protein
LREWVSLPDNPLPAKRVGGKLFVARVDFDSWMAAHPSVVTTQDVNAIVDEIVSSVTGGR